MEAEQLNDFKSELETLSIKLNAAITVQMAHTVDIVSGRGRIAAIIGYVDMDD